MSNENMSVEAVPVVREFDAPVEVIWKMWTDPEHFKQWYGPKGFTVPVAKIDLRIGGKHLFGMQMQTPKGPMMMYSTGEYIEIVPNQRLVYTDSTADENGNVVPPSSVGMPEGYPEVTKVTVILEDLGGRTKMTMTHEGVPAGANNGWMQAFDKMADHITTVLS